MVENYRQRAYPERQPGVRVWVSQPTTWKHRSSVQLGPLGWLGVCFCAPCNCQLLLTSISQRCGRAIRGLFRDCHHPLSVSQLQVHGVIIKSM
jgi:hypothetical protein